MKEITNKLQVLSDHFCDRQKSIVPEIAAR